MATLNVPGTYATIAAAVAAAAPGDLILVAAGYGGNESVNVRVDNLTFSAPADVPNIILSAVESVKQIHLAGASPIRIIGNSKNNHFTGNDGANDISDGGGGNDTIDGGGGNDLITSSGGIDTLRGGDGDDSIFVNNGGGGTVDGGIGIDTVYSPDLGTYTLSGVETLDTYYGFLTASLAQVSVFSNITAGLALPDAQIEISLRGKGRVLDFTDLIGGDHSLGIRDAGLTSAIDITGSVRGDFLIGSNFNDTLRGGAGDDTLAGGDGKDTLIGGSGIDTLSGGAGNDVLVGNDDGDTATYFDSTGVTVSLAVTTAQNTGSAGWDRLSGISNLVGSDYVDRLTGDANANHLDGGADDDTLFGRGGDDVLNGDNGADTLFGGAGADAISGGLGRDSAAYRDADAGVTVDLQNVGLNTGFAAGDTFSSIENLSGSRFGDSLYGDTGANRLVGKEGNDFLFGRDGSDRLIGGAGNDTLSGGTGSDLFMFNAPLDAATNVDTITDFSVSADKIALGNQVFTSLPPGPLAADAFFIGAIAQDAQDRIGYNSATGAVSYDADGNGAGAAIQFATLATGLSLTSSDFLVV